MGIIFKVEPKLINEALSEYVPGMNRSQLEKTEHNILILDAYNANPSSMKVAIENFAEHKANDKLLILGDMFELGEYSQEEHKKIVSLLLQYHFKDVILIGPEFSKANPTHFKIFLSTNDCLTYLKEQKIKNKTILIKGSRGMKLEGLKETL